MLIEENILSNYDKIINLFSIKLKKEITYPIDFKERESNLLASAIYATKTISCNPENMEENHIIVTLIHELTHLLCEDYKLYRAHDFVFGIFAALLRRKLINQSRNFFIPYDFHEDFDYKFLVLNPYEYDKKIMKANINDIQIMIKEAKRIAEEIREEIFDVEVSIIKTIKLKLRGMIWKIIN